MYDVALAVAACLKAGTRADVGWLVAAEGLSIHDWSETVVFTPGGGKIGALCDGVVDTKLVDLAGHLSRGRLVDVEITPVDALIAEMPSGGSARCLVAPADTLPAETWRLAAAREPFCLVSELEGDEVTGFRVFDAEDVSEADEWVGELFARKIAGSETRDGVIVSVFLAIPQMVVVGGGPVAESLMSLSRFLGWQPQLTADSGVAAGLIASLSGRDMVVIAAHDLEVAGAGLAAALDSGCGYIASVGSRKMQVDRADWLAYRGVSDLTRVHGPAGLDIGAGTPEEIAVAIVAEAIDARQRRRS